MLVMRSKILNLKPLFDAELLRDAADCVRCDDSAYLRAHEIVKKWADLEEDGHIPEKNEQCLDAEFLLEVFGDGLGYTTRTQSPEAFHLERSFVVKGIGTADGALGQFRSHGRPRVHAIIELKSVDTNLDRDKVGGRTPVQQLWDYLNGHPQCLWGVLSNFASIRLYHRDMTPMVYEQFTLEELRDGERFKKFYVLLRHGSLGESGADQTSLSLDLLRRSAERSCLLGDRHLKLPKISGAVPVIAQPKGLPASMEQIERIVAGFFGATIADLHSSRKTRTVALARAMVMYLLRKYTDMSFPEIGRVMGRKNHSTVILASRRIAVALGNRKTARWWTASGMKELPMSVVVEQLEDRCGFSTVSSAALSL
jgi:hypothetical protein